VAASGGDQGLSYLLWHPCSGSY